PHPTHAHVEMALEWLKRARVRDGVLTNMHVDLDYATLAAELPEGVRPAFDGMQVEFSF
ncbi:MAG: MBL fold metallo-hydrolase, partial [Alphaproteobacteria bacterium]